MTCSARLASINTVDPSGPPAPIVSPAGPVMPSVPLLKLNSPLTTRLPVFNVPPSRDKLLPTGMVVVLVTFRVRLGSSEKFVPSVVGSHGQARRTGDAQGAVIEVQGAAVGRCWIDESELAVTVPPLSMVSVSQIQLYANVAGDREQSARLDSPLTWCTLLDNQPRSVHELPFGVRACNDES